MAIKINLNINLKIQNHETEKIQNWLQKTIRQKEKRLQEQKKNNSGTTRRNTIII